MIKIFPVNSRKPYKTERFCALVDHNIVLSIETGHDGNEQKTCQNIKDCPKKSQCKYLTPTPKTISR